jgi:hypothetical protein
MEFLVASPLKWTNYQPNPYLLSQTQVVSIE